MLFFKALRSKAGSSRGEEKDPLLRIQGWWYGFDNNSAYGAKRNQNGEVRFRRLRVRGVSMDASYEVDSFLVSFLVRFGGGILIARLPGFNFAAFVGTSSFMKSLVQWSLAR